ncbi:MAG TPA: hypothetical protein VN838_02530 [Bradyrhizobium sp.]|nr:hypothetical protein [Bradyrhizobium sp.]
MPTFITPPLRSPAAKAGVATANPSDRAVIFKIPNFDIALLHKDQNWNIARIEDVVWQSAALYSQSREKLLQGAQRAAIVRRSLNRSIR